MSIFEERYCIRAPFVVLGIGSRVIGTLICKHNKYTIIYIYIYPDPRHSACRGNIITEEIGFFVPSDNLYILSFTHFSIKNRSIQSQRVNSPAKLMIYVRVTSANLLARAFSSRLATYRAKAHKERTREERQLRTVAAY